MSHADKVAVLVDLPAERDPRRMELCADHASGMSVPRGWTRVDDRDVEVDLPPQGPPTVTEITSLSTLEVLTAALAADPDVPVAAAGAPEVVDHSNVPDVGAGEPEAAESDDGPSTAAVMAATLARVPSSADDADFDPDPGSDMAAQSHAEAHDDGEVLEEVTPGGTQLVLAEAARMARHARPVPAARTD